MHSQDASANMDAQSSLDGAALPAAVATEKSQPAAASQASASTSASATAPRPESPAHASSLIAVRMAVKPGPGSVSPRDSVAPIACRNPSKLCPTGAAQAADGPRQAGAWGSLRQGSSDAERRPRESQLRDRNTRPCLCSTRRARRASGSQIASSSSRSPPCRRRTCTRRRTGMGRGSARRRQSRRNLCGK